MSKETKSAGKDRVFTVSVNKGEITTVYTQVAIDDCAGNFTSEMAAKMLADGEVIFSDEFYYAVKREALTQYEVVGIDAAPEPIEAPAPEAPEAGDVVVNIKNGLPGELLESEEQGLFNVSYTNDGKPKVVPYVQSRWRPATEAEFFAFQESRNTDITAPSAEAPAPVEPSETDEVIEGKVVDPLTAKERKSLEKLESEYDKVDTVERSIPFEKARILNEIRKGRLFRENYDTFAEYAIARFGITREYAQNLAQIADIPDLFSEALDAGVKVNLSIGAANEIMRDSNKFAKTLGVGKVEFEALKPVVRNILAVMADVAPKNAEGELQITPRFVSEFNKAIATHLTDGVVTIDGKQLSVASAHEQGLLNVGLRSEVLEATAESIKTNAQTIADEYARRQAEQEQGIVGAAQTSDKKVKYYKGDAPSLDTTCTLHGETEILSIGSGKMQTRCGCRWLIDSESGSLTAYEVNELPVKR